ncbi:hypothetical protein [Paenibacillus sp. IHBB 3054]|uniref:hypothetical protein n=1 Tax=Paenibacillus sp. IHBB 3054 TaxID=3425689 RepID=UPI003F67FA3F
MDKDLIPLVKADVVSISSEVDSFSLGLTRYLEYLGLPTSNVLVVPEERQVVVNNLPTIVTRLSPETKAESMYISKFIAACGAGLFDAALNFLWNETVINLRSKVVRFDLDYFLGSIINDPKRRATFKSEADLPKLDDWELIKGCKDTGIITDIGFKHLDYIRDMRNHASAAHPNHNDLDGLQLSSWLQTCIREVLGKEPEGPVLEVRRLLQNLRANQLTSADIPPIASNIRQLPEELITSTIRTVFGMFVDPELQTNIRNNLTLITPCLWNYSNKQSKHDIGLKYAIFSANADLPRKKLAYDFLTIVEGLTYLPAEQIVVEMEEVIESLLTAHNGWNNFYNEPVHARSLLRYIPDTGVVPIPISEHYVKVVVMCRIGNGHGVSGSALEYYEEMIGRFTEYQIMEFINLLFNSDIRSRLQFSLCAENFKALAERFSLTAVDIHVKNMLIHISKSSRNAIPNLVIEAKFTELYKNIAWG